MSSLLRNLLFALLLAIIVWLGYTLFFQEDELVTTTGGADGQAAQQTQEFLGRLQTLRQLEIDGTVFSDPRFNALQNFRQPLQDEPTGRQNPFAPVE